MSEQSPIESAIAQHAAGALANAEHAYRNILATDPHHAEARHYLGVLLHQQGQSQEGISLILRGLESGSGTASQYNDLGNILVQTGDLDNAVEAFRCSLAMNGSDANVWNNLGSVLHRQKDLANAESAYRNALHHNREFVPALTNLAALMEETGRDEESSLFMCQAYILPPLTGKPLMVLGIAYYRLGRIEDAAECYRAWLRAEPDNAIAKHHLAACTGEEVPAKATEDYLKVLFDDKAECFDEKLVGKLLYRGPEIIADLLDGYVIADGALDILDGGCGTGLCAPVLAPYARHLTGVDLSSGMLTKARERNLYDDLVEAELTDYLLNQKNTFDLIVMADTVIYFGDLAALFAAARQALRPGGILAFTTEEAAESKQYELNPSGRYGHSRRYLTQLLDAQGLALLRIDDVILRNEFCKPTQGIGVLASILPG